MMPLRDGEERLNRQSGVMYGSDRRKFPRPHCFALDCGVIHPLSGPFSASEWRPYNTAWRAVPPLPRRPAFALEDEALSQQATWILEDC